MENLLVRLRDGKLDYHSEMADALLRGARLERSSRLEVKGEIAAAWGLGCKAEAS